MPWKSRVIGIVAVVLLSFSTLAAQVASKAAGVVDVHVLAINDFHGALEPPAGATGRIAGVDAGGIEFLATHLAALKARNAKTVVVSAGDNIGGSPLLSSLSHDEASVEALNAVGLQLSAVGNHELDEGWWELNRIERGGCHPVDGCQDGTPFEGARFPYVAANMFLDPTRADPQVLAREHIQGTQLRRPFPASRVMTVGGVRIGFIGAILQDAPSIISPVSTRGLIFTPEAEAVNEEAARLRRQGIRAIVVLTHDGGTPEGTDINGCEHLSSDFVGVVNRMSADINVVVSGHTHRAYNCTIGAKLVTSAASNGRVITDIALGIRASDDRVVSKSARNVAVTRDVLPNRTETRLLDHYRPVADKIGHRIVGTVDATLSARESESGESPLGSVIADAMLEAATRTSPGDAAVAITNNGGIRADVVASGAHSPVTFAQLFDVTPFGNIVIVKTVTGEAILQALEQQRVQVSRGFTFTYNPSRPAGQRIDRDSVRLNGEPILATRSYRVATTDFVWNTTSALASATEPVTVGVDVDVLADYFSRHSPVSPPSPGRIRR
jgi:5'-nucleotidase